MSSSLFSIMHPQDRDSFTWHNYSEHLRETLKEMMTSSEFADVTLVTDDKQHIRAPPRLRDIRSICVISAYSYRFIGL